MSTNTLLTQVKGFIKSVLHIDSIVNALTSEFVGRGSDGVPTAGQDLGTENIPWGAVHATNIILDGVFVQNDLFVSDGNRIISGKIRSTSGQPDFIKPSGSGLSLTIEATVTPLVLAINNEKVTVATDIVVTGLDPDATGVEIRQVNATLAVDQVETKYLGEDDSILDISDGGASSIINALRGFTLAFEKVGGTEILYGFLDNTLKLRNCYRGYFFDSSGNPIVRETLNDTDEFILLKLGWIFIQNNGTTVDVSYFTPIVSSVQPTLQLNGDTLSDGQYWFDIATDTWKRHNGSIFEILNRILIGLCVMNTTVCIAARSLDFTKDFKTENSIQLKLFDGGAVLRSNTPSGLISVYGKTFIYQYSQLELDPATDLETGSIANNTGYYGYIKDDGAVVLSTERPYRRDDLKGMYHPYNSWRCIVRVRSRPSIAAFDNFTARSIGVKIGNAEDWVKRIEIPVGDWNMNTTSSVTIDFSLFDPGTGDPDIRRFRVSSIVIFDDTQTDSHNLEQAGNFKLDITTNQIILTRDTSGFFDIANFSSITIDHRGFISGYIVL